MNNIKLGVFLGVLLTATATVCAAESAAGVMEEGFLNPPVKARAMVYWDWIGGNVNRAAITRDLEHMKHVGLGGGLLFDVPPLNGGYAATAPAGPVDFMSKEWLDLVNFAAEESHRLGLDFGIVLCSAWNTGGPWIKPKDNNQITASSLLRVAGPQEQAIVLPPPSTDPDYVDVAVVAWPTPDKESRLMIGHPPKITMNGKPGSDPQLRAMIDGNRDTSAPVPAPQKNTPTTIEFAFAEPVTVDHFYIQEDPRFGIKAGRFEADVDGASRKLAEFESDGNTAIEKAFEPVTAKTFRLVATEAQRHAGARNMRLYEVALMEPGKISPVAPAIRSWALKTATLTALGKKKGERLLPDDHLAPTPDNGNVPAIPPEATLILTDKLGKDGHLNWEVPAGNWTVMRFGMVPTHSHTYNAEGRKGNEGALESDKMSAAASRLHYESMAGAIFQHLSPEGRKGLGFFHLDSWEGEENLWTAGFLEEFKKRRGYDLTAYLPVFDGCIVGNGMTSDRVLWDYRRTIGDLDIQNHFQTLAGLCHADGIKLSAQAGHGFQANMDTIGSVSQADYPSGEFWYSGRGSRISDVRNSVKDASSAVNVYGKDCGLFESFTTGRFPNWWPSPYDLKKLGDYAMSEGVSRMFFHGMWLDPVINNVPPGMNWSAGIHVGPSITWMPDGRAFFDYLARCQYLLQIGVADKDVLYFYGDGMPNITPRRDELWFALPGGRDYDATDSRAIRELVVVKDGKLTLPHGATYRTLVLPSLDTMMPETLEAIHRLVKDGAVVLGPKPLHSPSMSGQPAADEKLSVLADELWGKNPGTSGSRQTGKGTVYWGVEPADVFAAQGLPPQIETRDGGKSADIKYLARRIPDGRDIYFLSNQSETGTDVEILFRSTGKRPFFWHADTGEIVPAPVCAIENGRTRIPLRLAPYGSIFVVFAPEAGDTPVVFNKVEKDGIVLFPSDGQHGLPLDFSPGKGGWKIFAAEKGRYTLTGAGGKTSTFEAGAPEVAGVKGPWQVAFEKNRGAPESVVFDGLESWTSDNRPGIKYFSGYGNYTKTVNIGGDMLGGKRRVLLDLGRVGDVARVKVNGHDLGTLWKPPFCVDVTEFVHPGENALAIGVVNTWVNRLIGDDQFPREKPVANTLVRSQIPATDLDNCPSGLLGPVTLKSETETAIIQ